MCMLTYLQDIDRLSVYVVCNFALSSSFLLPIAILLCDMLVAYGPSSLINHQVRPSSGTAVYPHMPILHPHAIQFHKKSISNVAFGLSAH